ncbi:ABC transporter-like, ATP-binding domain [Dillenia turbinata]|uniref:ABC transporter-like, ATP-binding domain n=1 Tax=Dillenia turbinata TaxID=194707 RepID=A0AAN8Z0E7_9MAGN
MNSITPLSLSLRPPLSHRRQMEIESQSEAEVVCAKPNSSRVVHDDSNGVYLTWEDLWVTVCDRKNQGSRPILHGLTGYARPGELLAIMGPSGCGKSTLLDALAGRLGSNTRQSGEILINGRKQELAFGTSAYVTQDDTLTATLTVKEAIYYSAQLQLPDSMSLSEKKERAETTIKDMGLQDAKNTRIGGWGAKGLSGGQKRRVSICMEILTRPKLLFLDEPTSGLDSAASYHVMSRISALDHRDGRTIIASIHQPSSEVFALFHSLCLLSSGRVVYFGPAAAANEETGSLERRCHAGFLTQCVVLTKRSFINMNRDLGYYWMRLAIYIAITIGLGTAFYNIGQDYGSIQVFEREKLNGHYGTTTYCSEKIKPMIRSMFVPNSEQTTQVVVAPSSTPFHG